MNAVAAAFVFAPALALGSFLNVVAARVPLRRSIVRPPSACMSCSERIAWYDNVPVLSWFLLRGRCRHCKAAIPWVYPGVEVATAALVAGCVLAFGVTWEALLASFFCAVLVVISAIDLEHKIIPNRIVVPAFGVVLAAQTLLHPSPEWALAALGACGFLLVAAIVYPAGMGMGDVKLAGMMGLFLGRAVGPGMFAGLIAGSLVGGLIMARLGVEKGRKTKIPFGPYLAFGGIVGLFAGDAVVDWYLDSFS